MTSEMFRDWISLDRRGQPGPDGGIIVTDEELPRFGKVVMEEKTRGTTQEKYWAVTQAVFGWMVHTAYFARMGDAEEHAEAIKILMTVIQWREQH